jgi:hypothetical protein
MLSDQIKKHKMVRVWETGLAIHPLVICKISKTNVLISPQKTCDTLSHPRVASVELLQLETTHFLKM